MDWLLLYPLLPQLILFVRKLRHLLLRELLTEIEASNDLMVPLVVDLSTGTIAFSSLIRAILGSSLS